MREWMYVLLCLQRPSLHFVHVNQTNEKLNANKYAESHSESRLFCFFSFLSRSLYFVFFFRCKRIKKLTYVKVIFCAMQMKIAIIFVNLCNFIERDEIISSTLMLINFC